jgi:hypothetical protein
MAQPKIPRRRMLKVTGSTVKGVRFNANGTVDVVVGGSGSRPKKKAKRKAAKNTKRKSAKRPVKRKAKKAKRKK